MLEFCTTDVYFFFKESWICDNFNKWASRVFITEAMFHKELYGEFIVWLSLTFLIMHPPDAMTPFA